ncbi:hypothetical protein GGR54DRAFT_605477 [Hypoxylon sp. NC1633]|nr:hypothetical protein GGR54DRAFT_605477 [Hypoxylon sp. NC1633]
MTTPRHEAVPSLSNLYAKCIDSFGRFVLALTEDNCRVIRLEQVHLPEILEEYGRTKIWGDQTKAVLPARARGSLDDILRQDDELRRLVQGILQRLTALLSQAIPIAEKKYDPVVGSDDPGLVSDHDSISSAGTDSDCDSEGSVEHEHDRPSRIQSLVQQAFEQIRSLYDLSALLRRPKIADKYIRSVDSKADTTTLDNSGSLPLDISFSTYDESHVLEKVLQWRGLTKNGLAVKFDDESVATIGKTLQSHGVEDIMWFCQRLARANTRRREQLRYWVDHPYDYKQDTVAQVQKHEYRSEVSKFKLLNPNAPSKSILSRQSFSTAAVSDVHDTKTNVRPRTTYAPTAIGQGRFNSVPDPPKPENGKTTFSCPYCGMTLESSEMRNRQSWKRHIFRDLRPYVCTFRDCQDSGKLYVSRNDWMYHEFQIHRREYACKKCPKQCSSRKEMSVHLREHYNGSTPPGQLGVILDLCYRQIDVLDTRKVSCLICAEELLLSALHGHIATHMEGIALFVLPTGDEEEGPGNSKASLQAIECESRSQISDIVSDAGSVGYSVADDLGQTSEEFLRLLASEEAGYTSKFLSWSTIDEDTETGDIQDAEKTLKERMNTLGKEHPDTLISMNNLGIVLHNQGKYEEAVQIYRETLELMEQVLGKEDPITLANMNNLGSVLRSQGKYEEAEQIYRETLELMEQVLGKEDPITLQSMNNLGSVLSDQEKHEEAEQILREILELREQVLGKEHPDTFKSMKNLGFVLSQQGKYEEAQQIYRETLELMKQVLGKEHPNTLQSMNNLGFVLQQGKYKKVEQIHREILELME